MSAEIKAVKAKFTDELMAMDGVRSVGIGKNQEGNLAIIVGIEKPSEKLTSAIPDTLEGFPVVIKTVGDIEAK